MSFVPAGLRAVRWFLCDLDDTPPEDRESVSVVLAHLGSGHSH